MDQRAHLLLRCLDHPGMAVPGARHADAGGEIEVSVVVLVVEQNAVTASREHPGRLFEDL